MNNRNKKIVNQQNNNNDKECKCAVLGCKPENQRQDGFPKKNNIPKIWLSCGRALKIS